MRIINNHSLANLNNYSTIGRIDCDECQTENLEEVVELGSHLEPSYDNYERPVTICAHCLLKALQLINP